MKSLRTFSPMSIVTIVLLAILVLSHKLDTNYTINRLILVCILVALVLSAIANIAIYFNKKIEKTIWKNLMWFCIYSFGFVPLLLTILIIGSLLFFSIIGFIYNGEFKLLMVLVDTIKNPDFIEKTIICYGLAWIAGLFVIGSLMGTLKK